MRAYFLIITIFLNGEIISQVDSLSIYKEQKSQISERINSYRNSIISLEKQISLIDEKIEGMKMPQLAEQYKNQDEIVASVRDRVYLKSEPMIMADNLQILEPDTFLKILDYDYQNDYLTVQWNQIKGYVKYQDMNESESLKAFKTVVTQNKIEDFKKRESELVVHESQDSKKESYAGVRIDGIRLKPPNSAGGIDLIIQWSFLNDKRIIKYAYFTFKPYNSVGDVQSGEIREQTRMTVRDVGPFEAREWINEGYWANLWYNSTISCVKLTSVKVEYMDGSSYTYIKELPNILSNDVSNKCKYVDY